MRITTYCRLENLYNKYNGYISTKELLNEGISNYQIGSLVQEDYLERICHGHYWMKRCGHSKPKDYKCIEVCMASPRAVIAMKSACYYQGAMGMEPEILMVATERTDRSKLKMNFPVKRHYFAESNFGIGQRRVSSEFGCYNIYNVERSICDILRLKEGDLQDEFLEEISCQIKVGKERYERILKYAEMLKMNIPPSMFRHMRTGIENDFAAKR